MITSRPELEAALRVYLVADPDQMSGDLVDAVSRALAGGVTMVQLRAKTRTDRQIVELGRALLPLCRRNGAAFLMNDRVDLALALGADGVHLGVDDLAIEDARRIVPSEFVIGFSPETDDQAAEAAARGANYLGVGPVFGTVSKADAGEAIGLNLLTHRATLSRLPTIGIGGIAPENAASVIDAGACGVAVIGGILRASDPHHAAQALRLTVDGALAGRHG
jgi:thiamine-phosphate diphosphorylase